MKKMTTEVLKDLVCLSGLSVSPNETVIAFMEHTASSEDGKWQTRIRFKVRGTSQEIALPIGTSLPRFSPDGEFFYFLFCSSPNSLSCPFDYFHESLERQIARVSVKDLEPWLAGQQELDLSRVEILTHVPHGVTRYDLGQHLLVFEAPLWPDERKDGRGLREMTEAERTEFLWQREWGPRDITEIDYKRDESFGVRDGSVSTLGTVDLKSGEVSLIACPFPLTLPVLSPQEDRIACHGQPYSGPLFSAEELFVMAPDGSDLRQLTDDHLIGEHAPVFTLNGRHLIYPAWHMKGSAMAQTLMIRDLDLLKETSDGKPNGKPEELLDFSHPDMPGFDGSPLCRTQYMEGEHLLAVRRATLSFLCAMDGTENLYTLSLRGPRHLQTVYAGPGSIHEIVPVRNGYVVLWGDDHHMAEVCELSHKGHLTLLTDANRPLADYAQGEVTHLRVPSRDGKAVIHASVIRPAAFEEGHLYPAVLYLHGGPQVCYTQDFWHELQLLANAGFAVVTCDPRGSSGHGLAMCDEEASWDDRAVFDLYDSLEEAISLGFIDRNRVGVTGGSYGGYMTCKLIMREDCPFAAAVGQRVFVNKATSYGTGDMGFYSARQKPEQVNIRRSLMERSMTSIIRDLDSIHVPLLLLHGYQDYRCSFEQSEQMFIGLHERHPDVPVRLVMFPEANHDVSRTGLLPHRICHVQEMIRWFELHLKKDSAHSTGTVTEKGGSV